MRWVLPVVTDNMYLFYLFRYTRPVPPLSLERQLADNPEVNVTSTTSPSLKHCLDQLDNITEVRQHRKI